ncbi:MAG: glutathione S-transferase family protein [Solirubrobacterales bacterium]
MGVILWHIEMSHFNEKVRWALDYKRISYELRTPTPGTHRLTALRLTRGRHDRLPVIAIDGRRIGDSTAIIAALEQYRREPALYPADPDERARALELEDYFDEELAPRVRRLFWHHTLDNPEAAADAALSGRRGVRWTLMVRAAPVIERMLRRDYDIGDASAAEAAEGVRAVMHRVESELRPSGHLAGDELSVADISACALFTPLLAPPERPWAPPLPESLLPLREELEARTGGAWVAETYARHRGSPAPAPR